MGWIVAIGLADSLASLLAGGSCSDDRKAASPTACAEDYRVVFSVVDVAQRSCAWHVVPIPSRVTSAPLVLQSAMTTQLQSLLKDIRWWQEHDSTHDSITVFILQPAANPHLESFSHVVRECVSHHRNAHFLGTISDSAPAVASLGDVDRREIMCEDIQRIAASERKLQVARRSLARFHLETVAVLGLHAALTGVTGDDSVNALQAPEFEHTFCVDVVVHDTPLRDHMRMNPAARDVFVSGHGVQQANANVAPLLGLLAPYCASNHGRRCLQSWLGKPEVDNVVISRRHDIVASLAPVVMNRTSNPTDPPPPEILLAKWIMSLLENLKILETTLVWFIGGDSEKEEPNPPPLQDFGALQDWISSVIRVNSDVSFALKDSSFTIPPALQEDILSALDAICRSNLEPFLAKLTHELSAFLTTTPRNDAEGERVTSSGMGTRVLRVLQGSANCEASIRSHADEIAAQLLIPPERVKVIYDDGDNRQVSVSRGSRSVLFRVSKQDAHRVFRSHTKPVVSPNACPQDVPTPLPSSTSIHLITMIRTRRATGVWFTTPTLDRLASTWSAHQEHATQLEAQVVQVLVHHFQQTQMRQSMLQVAHLLAQMDALTTFASVSYRNGFTRPKLGVGSHISEQTDWMITDLRDPWRLPTSMARRSSCGDNKEMCVSLRFNASHSLIVVHGNRDHLDRENVLHRLAMVVILNQIGCFVPCQFAKLPVFDTILLRAGAVDDTLQNQSTFLTEMHTIGKMMHATTPRSLILMDELCRGTSAAEGLALARAICHHFREKQACVCLTTQWEELIDALRKDHGAAITTPSHSQRHFYEGEHIISNQSLHSHSERFIDDMHTSQFPTELQDLILQEMDGSFVVNLPGEQRNASQN